MFIEIYYVMLFIKLVVLQCNQYCFNKDYAIIAHCFNDFLYVLTSIVKFVK